MVGRKMLLAVVVTGIIALGVQSCSKTPIACFTTTPNMDSIHVNDTVIFNANCSVFAGSYNWQFYNNQDSVAFTAIVTKVFRDTGKVDVYLLVNDGNNFADVDQTILVLP
jgi:hypothetical protein